MSGKRSRAPGAFKILSSAAVRDAVGFKPVGWPAEERTAGKRKRADDEPPADTAVAAHRGTADEGTPRDTLVMTRERLPPELAKCSIPRVFRCR